MQEAVTSPMQRRLLRLQRGTDAGRYTASCRIRIPGRVTDAALAAAVPVARTGLAEDVPLDVRAEPAGPGTELVVSAASLHADPATLIAAARRLADTLDGGPDTTPADPPSLTHQDAARWWNGMLVLPDAAPSREFWRARAQGRLPFHDPAGRRRFDEEAVRTDTAHIDGGDLRTLRAHCDRAGVPVAAWLAACFHVLVRRLTGAEGDLLLAVATDLRRHPDLHGCPGPLTPYLPTRLTAPARRGLTALAREAAEQIAAGAGQGECFDWDNVAVPDDDPPALPAGFDHVDLTGDDRVAAVDARWDRFALRLHTEEHTDRLTVAVDHAVGELPLLATDTLAESFRTLLLAALAAPERPAAALPVVGPGQAGRLTAGEESPKDGAAPVTEAILDRARTTPGATAVRCGDDVLDYAGLADHAAGLAARLVDAGVRQDEPVAVLLGRSTRLPVALLGVLDAGCPCLPVDPALPERYVHGLLAAAGVRFAVVPPEGSAGLPAGVRPVPVTADAAPGARPGRPAAHQDRPAWLLRTDGATTVTVSRGALAALLDRAGRIHPMDGAHGTLVRSSPDSEHTVLDLFLPLLAGKDATLLPPGADEQEHLIRALAAGTDYSLLRLPPSRLRALTDRTGPWPGPIRVRRLAVEGGPDIGDPLDRWRELAPDTEVVTPSGPAELLAATLGTGGTEGPSAPAVRPAPGVAARVLDENLLQVPIGVVGELHLGGPGLADGRRDRPGPTAERFVPDPYGRPGTRLLRTGDLVRALADGSLEPVGRTDDRLTVDGRAVEPAEAETALREHEAVREAVVVPVGTGTELRLAAYVVADEDRCPPADELRAFLADRLPAPQVPDVCVRLDALPTTANGTLDRAALPDPEPAPGGADREPEYAAPRDEVELALAGIWSEVLGVDRVGIHDNFFALGGDSILSILVASRAARHGLRVDLRLFFEEQTIARLAPFVERVAELPAAADPALGAGSGALTPVQRWFFEQGFRRAGTWNQGWLFAVGELDADLLAAALGDVTAHHPALRTGFADEPGAPVRAFTLDSAPVRVERIDLADRTDWETALAEALRGMQDHDLAEPPLLRAALVDGGRADRRRLVLVAHHLVVDAVSWRIVLDDLVTAYDRRLAGEPVHLPAATTSPQAWAAALTDRADAFAAELDHWLSQAPTGPAPLPVDHPDQPPAREADRVETTVRLDPERTRFLLRDLPAAMRVDYVLLAAVTLAFGAWTGRDSLHVDLEGQGRVQHLVEGADLYRSVGWFTTFSPLLVRLPSTDPMEAALAVREQIHAMPEQGIGHGVLRHLSTRDGHELAALPLPQVSVDYVGPTGAFGRSNGAETAPGLDLGPAPEPLVGLIHPDNLRPRRFGVNARALGGSLQITIDYSGRHYEATTVDKLARAVLERLEAVLDACRGYAENPAPQDFPALAVDRATLSKVLAKARAKAHEEER
ncbi:condensation domain-containing protein [Streptomyces sp. NPDC059605]|uniref:condensation domain-containing protein n=1 Tax=unclassified Streptomyces TaxID=2593676 RepID=UPI00368FF25F